MLASNPTSKFLLLKLHNSLIKLCSKQNYNTDLLHQIVAPPLNGGWWHNYSTKTRQVGQANEQSFLNRIFKSLLIVSEAIFQ